MTYVRGARIESAEELFIEMRKDRGRKIVIEGSKYNLYPVTRLSSEPFFEVCALLRQGRMCWAEPEEE